MALFKCKMCGGALEITAGASVIECEYCGTQQTLPKLDDDRRANMYDRANHFRRNNEFDKAMDIYENILNEDSSDAEAYWSLVLCRYGIEYVEDPVSHKHLPTVNRAQFTSIFDDDNYKSALQYADGYQKSIYEAEAKAINEIQKSILAISQREEPFDVFICYKETDNNGRRTHDSVLANDLYHQLIQEGFKVFFSRITLEDKLGSAYEPYIFAALNSAKVMVVLGTRPEHFKAVWVRNEWSRYLSLIKQGQKKMLIPAYKDMDPYDLPEEFSHLQAQDMSKLGFMQDLIRGIKKIIQADAPTETVVKETLITGGGANTAALLKRAFMFLEDGDWNSADEYCEKVLDSDPENARAYLGKLMAELRVRNEKSLKNCDEPFDGKNNYRKVLRFADEELQTLLTGSVEHIRIRNENARIADIYERAKRAMASAGTEEKYKEAAAIFESVKKYQDSAELAKECYKKAEIARKDAIRTAGIVKMNGEKTIADFEQAIKLFERIPGWRDADEKVEACKKSIEELKAKAEAERLAKEKAQHEAEKRAKKKKKITIITVSSVCAAIAAFVLIITVIIPSVKYNGAIELMNAGQYNEAIAAFEAMDGYKDSVNKIKECNEAILDGKYNYAIALMESSKYNEAIVEFEALNYYKDSAEQIEICEQRILQNKYDSGIALLKEGKYDESYAVFEDLGNYRDSEELCKETRYQQALVLWNNKEFEQSNTIFEELKEYKDSSDKIHQHDYVSELLKEPTCDNEGEEKLSCKECSHNFTQTVEPLDHKYNDGQIIKAPTCTVAGEKMFTCQFCEKTYIDPIPVQEHNYSSTITKDATCDSDGTKVFTCSCGKNYTETIKAIGHNYSDATCTTAKTCSVCGKVSGTPSGHSWEAATTAKPKTCKVCGATEGGKAVDLQGCWYSEELDGVWKTVRCFYFNGDRCTYVKLDFENNIYQFGTVRLDRLYTYSDGVLVLDAKEYYMSIDVDGSRYKYFYADSGAYEFSVAESDDGIILDDIEYERTTQSIFNQYKDYVV